MSGQFAFQMRVAEKDLSGYYHVNWDNAVPLVVHATNRTEAFNKCCAVMGESARGRGWGWTAKIDRITEVPDLAAPPEVS